MEVNVDELCDQLQSGINTAVNRVIKPEAKKFFNLFNAILNDINNQNISQSQTTIEKLGKVNTYLTTEFNMENYTSVIEKILNNEQMTSDELNNVIKNIKKNIDMLKLLELVCLDQQSNE
jgi:hypothetical protein